MAVTSTIIDILKSVFNSGTSSLNVTSLGTAIVTSAYDYVAITYPTTTQEVYTYKTGGSGGTTVATVTINYVDATKVDISDMTRT